MKKILIGAVVGGLIIFIWQFVSFALINFHKTVQNRTDKQEAIMSFLNSQGLKEGGYVMPIPEETATMEQHQAFMKEHEGKPWASLQYHTAMKNNMVGNIIHALIVDIVIVALFCWFISRMTAPGFGTILGAALMTGLIVFLNSAYTNYIWYQIFDVWAHLLDAFVAWGLAGVWLAWWLRRGANNSARQAVTY